MILIYFHFPCYNFLFSVQNLLFRVLVYYHEIIKIKKLKQHPNFVEHRYTFLQLFAFVFNFASGAATEDADVIFWTERKVGALPKTENRQADQYLAGWSDWLPGQLAGARQCAAHAWKQAPPLLPPPQGQNPAFNRFSRCP